MAKEVYIPSSIQNKLIGSYKANKEELKELRTFIHEHGQTDDGLADATESFEQGYNNALEFVFQTLGIEF